MKTNNTDFAKFQQQNAEYYFPYHYIPHIDKDGTVVTHRRSGFGGYEYYAYMLHVKSVVDKLNPNSLLDIGCGDGVFINMMKNHVNRVKGVDLSEGAIFFAKAFYYADVLNTKEVLDNTLVVGTHEFQDKEIFECIDAANLTETFDVVTAIEVLEHIPEEYIREFFCTLYNRVKDDGSVIITIPTFRSPLSDKHYRHYDISTFKHELQKSGVELNVVDYTYIVKQSIFIRFLNSVFHKYWYVDVRFISKIVWKYYWSKLRFADEKTGRHLCITLKRKSG